MLATKLLSAMAGGEEKLYAEDVFSAYTYTGNGSTQTITNGIDLAGKGGLVWTKSRSAAYSNAVQDTARGRNNILFSNDIVANQAYSTSINSFNANGYTLGSETLTNQNGTTYVGWTFRKAAKFFDVVTYTGDGTSSRSISHNLGSVPGMMIVKRTSSTGNWWVYHRAMDATANDYYMFLESTAAKTNTNAPWNDTTPTSTQFTLGGGGVNTNAETYVAYLFAHDTGTDGLIQCGSFTTDGSGAGPFVDLGWEPQFVLYKDANYVTGAGGDWNIVDSSRGMRGYAGLLGDPMLEANTTAAEQQSAGYANATATGFYGGGTASHTYIYLAIRRPNKPPTVGTQVYNAIARTGTGAAATVTGVGFAPDMVTIKKRTYLYVRPNCVFDKLRGTGRFLSTSLTAGENTYANTLSAFTTIGVTLGSDASSYVNDPADTYINHFFKRAPGVMDQICFSGSGANKTETHGLTVAPELWLVKGRSGATQWVWGSSLLAAAEKIVMPTPAGKATDATAWNSTYPTSSVLSLGTAAEVNTNAATYAAYLWATKAGISKVFSYTGNGSSQNIDCGFTTGARFILIVRTSAAGSVYVWDTVRGVVAGNDPHLALDTTAAEVTTDDSVDPLASGFTVNQVAATNINVTSATYIGLAYS